MGIYIQITNRCNMTCEHCAFSCTIKGKDMTRETFNQAIELAIEYNQDITIGGGEPTLHPLFKDFMSHAIWEMAGVTNELDAPAVNIITNGSNTKIAIKLATLAKTGTISASLSKDQYHDPIDPSVYKAFTKPKKENYNMNHRDSDLREIRTVNHIIAAGRAKNWAKPHKDYNCPCENVFITPLGNIYTCGCKKSKINRSDITSDHFFGYCEKSHDFKQETQYA